MNVFRCLRGVTQVALCVGFAALAACAPCYGTACEEGVPPPPPPKEKGLELLRGFYSTEPCEAAPQETCTYANVYFVVKRGDKSVTDLTADQMDMVINGRDVGVEGAKKLTTSNGLLVRLLMDSSYSITESGSTDTVRDSAVSFIQSLPEAAQISPAEFASEPTVPIFLYQDGSTSTETGILTDKASAAQTVQSYYDSHQALTSTAQTKLYDAFARWSQFTPNNPELQFLQAVMVVFTDGADTASLEYTSATSARSHATQVNPTQRVYAIGLGNDIDEEALRTLSEGRFYKATVASELQQAFDEVANDLSAIYLLRVLVATQESNPIADLTVHDGDRTLKATFNMTSL